MVRHLALMHRLPSKCYEERTGRLLCLTQALIYCLRFFSELQRKNRFFSSWIRKKEEKIFWCVRGSRNIFLNRHQKHMRADVSAICVSHVDVVHGNVLGPRGCEMLNVSIKTLSLKQFLSSCAIRLLVMTWHLVALFGSFSLCNLCHKW